MREAGARGWLLQIVHLCRCLDQVVEDDLVRSNPRDIRRLFVHCKMDPFNHTPAAGYYTGNNNPPAGWRSVGVKQQVSFLSGDLSSRQI